MKIDVYSHILPKKYTELYAKKNAAIKQRVEYRSIAVTDIDVRLRLMNRYPDVLQVLTVANIPLETFAPAPADAIELAKIANEELAELAYKELWETMARLDLPIWIHPATYDKLDNDIGLFSWPFETTSAMFRLVTAGVFNDYPNIKFITHHCGAMVPFFQKRIKWVLSLVPGMYPTIKHPEEHFRKFYNDTAVYGNTSALMCGYDFFGPDHLLYGTDCPLGPKFGLTGETAESIERMAIPAAEKEKIFFGNAANLLTLPH